MADIEINSTGDRYRTGNLLIRHATLEDDDVLRQILRSNPMQGWVQLALERSPSYFAGENLLGRSRAIVGEDTAKDGTIIGMYHNNFLPVFVNGAVVQAGYLGELRINPIYRNRIRVLKHGFAAMRPLNRPEADETDIWFTSIAKDNDRARRLLESQHQELPRYRPVGEIQTLALSTRHAKKPQWLRTAAESDIPALCDFYNRQAKGYHLAPHLDPNWLDGPAKTKGLEIEDFWLWEENGNIEACLAIWDQRAFKQAVVRGYRFPLDRLRPIYNLIAYLQKRPLLPEIGTQIESVYLAFFAISPGRERFVESILREALHAAGIKQAKLALLGLSENHSILSKLIDAFRPTVYKTVIETVNWPDEVKVELNQNLVQPEIAIL